MCEQQQQKHSDGALAVTFWISFQMWKALPWPHNSTILPPPLFIEVAWFDELFNRSMDVAFIPVAKPHTHKLYILRHCSNDVYLFQVPHRSHHNILLHMLSWTSLPAHHSHVIIMMDLTAVLGGLPLDTVVINFTYVVVSPFVLFSFGHCVFCFSSITDSDYQMVSSNSS